MENKLCSVFNDQLTSQVTRVIQVALGVVQQVQMMETGHAAFCYYYSFLLLLLFLTIPYFPLRTSLCLAQMKRIEPLILTVHSLLQNCTARGLGPHWNVSTPAG